MKFKVLVVSVAVLSLAVGAVPLVAQQRAPRIVDLRDLMDSVMPILPQIPPMAVMAPLPAMPPMPPLPPLPMLEGFAYTFGQQASTNTVDPAVRFQQEVFRTLLRNSPERALDLAADRLKSDPSDTVVLGNLSSIANTESPKALPLLISIAKKSTNVAARNEATQTIARSRNGKDGLATLEDLYASSKDSVEVRRTVVSSMSRTTDPRSVSVLAKIAKDDPDESIRRSAVQYLGMRKEPEALKALEDLLKTRG